MSDQKISISNGKLTVPENPTVPFIEGDGTGVDIWPASQYVFDAAVEKAYKGKRKINWKEVLAGVVVWRGYRVRGPDAGRTAGQ